MSATATATDLNAIANLESERDELRDLLADRDAMIEALQKRIASLFRDVRELVDAAEHDVERIG